MREENVDLLRANGRLFFLDRPLLQLLATPDRPLSSNADAVRERYQERYPIYSRVADAVLDGSGTVAQVGAQLLAVREEINL